MNSILKYFLFSLVLLMSGLGAIRTLAHNNGDQSFSFKVAAPVHFQLPEATIQSFPTHRQFDYYRFRATENEEEEQTSQKRSFKRCKLFSQVVFHQTLPEISETPFTAFHAHTSHPVKAICRFLVLEVFRL